MKIQNIVISTKSSCPNDHHTSWLTYKSDLLLKRNAYDADINEIKVCLSDRDVLADDSHQLPKLNSLKWFQQDLN